MTWAPRLGKTDRRTWTSLGFEADEADFNITLPTMDDKSSCLGTITSITSMTGRLPRCSQHESPGESGGRFNQLAPAKATLRTRAEILRFFDGLELLEPGLVQVQQWRPGLATPGHNREAAGYCGLARKT
jgi:hypothetical protein